MTGRRYSFQYFNLLSCYFGLSSAEVAYPTLDLDVGGFILAQNLLFLFFSDAEADRLKEYAASVKVQTWFRGTRVRSYFK